MKKTPDTSSENQRLFIGKIFIFLFFTAILVIHACYYLPYICDDALISLQYVKRFLHGNGLTWAPGKPVEGYSNLLWILCISVLGYLKINLILAARILGICCFILIPAILVYHYSKKRTYAEFLFPVSMALFFFTLSTPIAVWSIGGLEQPLYGLLLALVIPLAFAILQAHPPYTSLLFKKAVVMGILLGLMCLTRPDGPIFTIAVFLAVLWNRQINKKPFHFGLLSIICLIPFMFFIGQLVFRLNYYGAILPNTALVKIAPSATHTIFGEKYLTNALISMMPFSLLAFIGLFFLYRNPQTRDRAILLILISLLWISYLAFIGGDIFPSYRHAIPIVVVLTYALAETCFLFASWIKNVDALKAKNIKIIIYTALYLLFMPYMLLQMSDPQNARAKTENWVWHGKVTGLFLKHAFYRQKPLVAVAAAGCIPYFSDLPCLDMLGLNDYYLPRNRPKKFGSGHIGHELEGSAYILGRKPDIIVFHTGTKWPASIGTLKLSYMPEFNQQYTDVTIDATDPYEYHAHLYIRKYGQKLGIQKSDDTITIPGYLLKLSKIGSGAYLNTQSQVVVSVDLCQDASVTIENIKNPNWQVKIDAIPPDQIKPELQITGKGLKLLLTTESVKPIEIVRVILEKKH